MIAPPFERVSVRVALAIGFCVTLGLWLYTGYAFQSRIDQVQREASEVATRYTRAQDLLATVRAQVLLSSVRVRDALLNPEPQLLAEYRQHLQSSRGVVKMALADYEPVVKTSDESEQIARLMREADQFHDTSIEVLNDAAGRSPGAIREILTSYIGPRREAAVAMSEEIQSLNRRAYIQQQNEIAEIHRLAERDSRRGLGIALVTGLGVLLLTSVYAGRLESRLRSQLKRDIRISRELHETATKLISAQEEERRRIARELHDEVGQLLTAVKVELTVAKRALEQSGVSAEPLAEAQSITDGALRSVRNLTQLLHPSVLDDLGLAAAIDASLRGLARRHDIRTELTQAGMAERLPREVELAAYRIVQEALTNVAKHAHARQCFVHLTHLPERLLIEVEDDGVGLSDTAAASNDRGLGLVSVRERAARLGGTFNILSGPGQGTRLVVSLPDRGAVA
ncbi:MAG TPA: sensor histidine kinase [Vicinamibacterales bacterium]|nr:sensor histidine kinase [Vicinamibacterales bacterium]